MNLPGTDLYTSVVTVVVVVGEKERHSRELGTPTKNEGRTREDTVGKDKYH